MIRHKLLAHLSLNLVVFLVLFILTNSHANQAYAGCNLMNGQRFCGSGSILTCDVGSGGGCVLWKTKTSPIGWGECGCLPSEFCNWRENSCGDDCSCGSSGGSSTAGVSIRATGGYTVSCMQNQSLEMMISGECTEGGMEFSKQTPVASSFGTRWVGCPSTWTPAFSFTPGQLSEGTYAALAFRQNNPTWWRDYAGESGLGFTVTPVAPGAVTLISPGPDVTIPLPSPGEANAELRWDGPGVWGCGADLPNQNIYNIYMNECAVGVMQPTSLVRNTQRYIDNTYSTAGWATNYNVNRYINGYISNYTSMGAGSGPGHILNTYHGGTTIGTSSVTLTFKGNSVDYIRPANSNSGIFEVFVDGVSRGTTDDRTIPAQPQKRTTYTGFSSAVEHTLEIKLAGRTAPANGYLYLDAFEVKPAYNGSLPISVPAVGKSYCWAVRANNGSTVVGPYSPTYRFTYTPNSVGNINLRAIESDDLSCPVATMQLLSCVTPPCTVRTTLSGPQTVTTDLVTSATYNTIQNLLTGTYSLAVSSYPPQYTSIRYCPASSSQVLGENETLSWDIIFSTAADWFQVIDGGIHSNKSIVDPLPVNQYLAVNSSGNNSPVVSYSDIISPDLGSGTVSTQRYLVNDPKHTLLAGFSYYDYYFSKFGAKTLLGNNILSAKPANLFPVNIYQAPGSGNLTISTAGWNVANGESYVFFVPGNLNINLPVNTGKLTVQQGGFLSFIVNGSITVNNTVGYSQANFKTNLTVDPVTDAHISGIFITNSTFITSPTTGAQDSQLILAGSYIAGNFTLQRDLDASNNTYPAELFVFRPDFWRYAPDALKEIDLVWKEVAP